MFPLKNLARKGLMTFHSSIIHIGHIFSDRAIFQAYTFDNFSPFIKELIHRGLVMPYDIRQVFFGQYWFR